MHKLAVNLLFVLCFIAFNVSAENISVIKTDTRTVDDAYEIWADFKITLPPSVEHALIHGVVLNFVSELKITRSRWYWLDKKISDNEQTTRLSYNALTRQYRISRGTLFQSFANLEAALRVLGHQTTPLVPKEAVSFEAGYVANLLNNEIRYTAFARLRLDTSQLPKPLQVSALTNSDWNLESEPYSWPLNFDASNKERGSKQ